MRKLLGKTSKALAYLAAALIILLAIGVGLFRLLLPKLPEYQEEIKTWANTAIGMQVQFEDMAARWRLSGPELTFQRATLTAPDGEQSLISAGEVSVGVSLLRLLRDRQILADRVEVKDASITVQHSENDGWLVQGVPIADALQSRDMTAAPLGNVAIVVNDVSVDYLLPHSSEWVTFVVERLSVERDEVELRASAVIGVPEHMGDRLDVLANQRHVDSGPGVWRVFVEGQDLRVAGWSELDVERLPQFRSGVLDMSASLQFSTAGLDHATIDFILDGFGSAARPALSPLSAEGRVDYSKDANGWLVAASNFSLNTQDNLWPLSSLSVQITEASDTREADRVVASASYINLDDLDYVAEWLPENLRIQFDAFDPSGALRNLSVVLDNLQTDTWRFDIASELIDAGVKTTPSFPGIRRVNGAIRADNAGGRVEMASTNLRLDIPTYVRQPITFDEASGTVIWRQGGQGTTVVSDSIRLRNAILDSESSLQIDIPSGDGAPIVDFRSDWSVADVAAAKRYLPQTVIKPKLYQWLDTALVGGSISRGNTQLVGPLDRFPFDGGEGTFRIDSHFDNLTLRYSDKWPDVESAALDVSVDGMRLYSEKNSSVSAGNSVVDAFVEIADLRQPVLTIDAFATGSLETIRQFFDVESDLKTLRTAARWGYRRRRRVVQYETELPHQRSAKLHV